MIDIHQGDRDPKVVLLQILLSTRPPQAQLVIDGAFGQRTRDAVIAFQRANPPLRHDGVVDTATWQKLMAAGPFASVDHADLDDAVTAVAQGVLVQQLREGHIFGLVAAHESATAGMPMASLSVGMSNGVSVMINQVIAACGGRRLALLRVFGHAGAGMQIVSAGRGVTGGAASHGSALTAQAARVMRQDWGRLAPHFARMGSAELHGCRVAHGPQGRALLDALADMWQVPVSAAAGRQRVGRGETARFEGPVTTAFPGRGVLRTWAQRVAATEGSASFAPPR